MSAAMILSWLSMGGYAGFVWPAYAAALVLMVALLVVSLRAARRRETELEAARSVRRPRRPRDAQPTEETGR